MSIKAWEGGIIFRRNNQQQGAPWSFSHILATLGNYVRLTACPFMSFRLEILQ